MPAILGILWDISRRATFSCSEISMSKDQIAGKTQTEGFNTPCPLSDWGLFLQIEDNYGSTADRIHSIDRLQNGFARSARPRSSLHLSSAKLPKHDHSPLIHLEQFRWCSVALHEMPIFIQSFSKSPWPMCTEKVFPRPTAKPLTQIIYWASRMKLRFIQGFYGMGSEYVEVSTNHMVTSRPLVTWSTGWLEWFSKLPWLIHSEALFLGHTAKALAQNIHWTGHTVRGALRSWSLICIY